MRILISQTKRSLFRSFQYSPEKKNVVWLARKERGRKKNYRRSFNFSRIRGSPFEPSITLFQRSSAATREYRSLFSSEHFVAKRSWDFHNKFSSGVLRRFINSSNFPNKSGFVLFLCSIPSMAPLRYEGIFSRMSPFLIEPIAFAASCLGTDLFTENFASLSFA